MPLDRKSATTTSTPRFSMVRRPRVLTRRLMKRFSDSDQNRWLCKLGRKRRRLRLFACETVLPVLGPLPVTWQTRDMAKPLNLEALGEPRFIPGCARASKALCQIRDQIQRLADIMARAARDQVSKHPATLLRGSPLRLRRCFWM